LFAQSHPFPNAVAKVSKRYSSQHIDGIMYMLKQHESAYQTGGQESEDFVGSFMKTKKEKKL
jgi:hypothetical protein